MRRVCAVALLVLLLDARPVLAASVGDFEPPGGVGVVVGESGVVVEAGFSDSVGVVGGPVAGSVGPRVRCGYFEIWGLEAGLDVSAGPVRPVEGAAYFLNCWVGEGELLAGYPLVVIFDPGGPIGPGVLGPEGVAEFARRRIEFVAPVAVVSPAESHLVGVESWLAVTSELSYSEVTAQAGLVWASVRPELRDVVWDFGNGESLGCVEDVAVVWGSGVEESACVHVFESVSGDEAFAGSVTVTWDLWWSSSRDAGWVVFDTVSLSTPVDFDVVELQAARP